MQLVSMQRIGKQVHAATKKHRTIKLLSETVFSTWSVQRGYKEDNWGDPVSWKSGCEEKTLYMCCSYSQTVIITVKIRCQDTTSESWRRFSV
jgi:hypothetical protein